MRKIFLISVLFVFNTVAFAQGHYWSGSRVTSSIEVTITNLTKGQQLTPVLVALQGSYSNAAFELGEPASDEIEALAEGGDSASLLASLTNVLASDSTEGLLDPGASATVRFDPVNNVRSITVASMLIPTNDAFFVKSVGIPNFRRGPESHLVRAYDAGTELNDELCIVFEFRNHNK